MGGIMTIGDYNLHPCPECGHKIGSHSNSPFGHNPSNRKGEECSRTHHSLVIEKLTAWLEDVLKERDIYIESYENTCKERDSWQNTATVFSVKLKNAMNALKGVSYLWHGRGLAPEVLVELDKTIAEIEDE